MRAAEPIPEEEFDMLSDASFPDWEHVAGTAGPFEHDKAENWGRSEGRLVAIDYSAASGACAVAGQTVNVGPPTRAQTDKQPVPLEPASETTDVTAKGIDSTPTEPALYFPHVLVEFA